MEISELRDLLQTKLGSTLGTYRTEQGKTIAAIRIIPPMVPNGYEITGLEVLIQRALDTESQAVTEGKIRTQNWVIYLVQHDRTKTTQDAYDIIDNLFPIVTNKLMNQTRSNTEMREIKIRVV
jgi:hypothetical protein